MALFEASRAAIYAIHLTEASFLYEQRQRYLDDPELTFEQVAALEARLEAHVDGLVLGGAQARAMCSDEFTGADPGLAYAAACVLCRQGARDALSAALDALDVSEDASAQAVGDALTLELPEAWYGLALAGIETGRPELRAIWARVSGCRGWSVAAPALFKAGQAAASGDRTTTLACIAALGDVKEPAAKAWLQHWLDSDDAELARTAALSLLKNGVALSAADVRRQRRTLPTWSAVPLVFADQISARQLEALTLDASDRAAGDVLLALGLLGDLSALPYLLEKLKEHALGGAAASALFLITGVTLLEQVAAPEVRDPELDQDLVDVDSAVDAASPESARETPVRPTTVIRLARDPVRWRAALSSLPSTPHTVRMGRAVSSSSTVAALNSLSAPLQVRRFLLDDLQIRGHTGIRVRADDPVLKQRGAWAMLAASAETQPFRFEGDRRG